MPEILDFHKIHEEGGEKPKDSQMEFLLEDFSVHCQYFSVAEDHQTNHTTQKFKDT